MKKIIAVLLLASLLLPVLRAEETDPALKAIEDQIKAASTELGTMKSALMKELKDDPTLMGIKEKKKALEKEEQDYLQGKKPELADLQKKIEDLKKQLNDARKAAKGKDKAAKKIE